MLLCFDSLHYNIVACTQYIEILRIVDQRLLLTIVYLLWPDLCHSSFRECSFFLCSLTDDNHYHDFWC